MILNNRLGLYVMSFMLSSMMAIVVSYFFEADLGD